MKRFNILAMFRELEAERDKARTWAAKWKRAAKKWKELAGLNLDWAEKWREDYEKVVAVRYQLKASTELLELREEQLAEELRRRAELEQELRLNVSMLARQCDLAREAETERDELKQKLEACQAEAASWKVRYQTLVARLTE